MSELKDPSTFKHDCRTCKFRLTIEHAFMKDQSYEDMVDICLACNETGENPLSGYIEKFAITCGRARKSENLCGFNSRLYKPETKPYQR